MDAGDIYETLNEAYFSDDPHEREVIDHLPLLLDGVRVGVDCGASLGQYTRALARNLSGGAVHAIEADPIRFEELTRNGARWADETGTEVITHHRAVTDVSGTMPFYVTNSNISGGLSKHTVGAEVEWEEIEMITTTLDSLFPDEPPGFVKVDVEGAELAVLRGATRILQQGTTTFLVELHESWGDGDGEDVVRLLDSYGYRRAFLFGQTVFTTDQALRRRLLALELRTPSQLTRRGKSLAKRALRRVGAR